MKRQLRRRNLIWDILQTGSSHHHSHLNLLLPLLRHLFLSPPSLSLSTNLKPIWSQVRGRFSQPSVSSPVWVSASCAPLLWKLQMSTSIIHIHPTKQSSWQWRNFSMVKTRMEQPFYDLSGNDITGRSHQKQFSIRKTKQYWCLFCLLRALSPNIIKWMNIFVRVHLIFFSNFILRVIWSVANSKRIRETWFSNLFTGKTFHPFCG